MTWGEWGSLVYRDGQRRMDRENDWKGTRRGNHALIGDGPLQLEFDRDLPILLLEGRDHPMNKAVKEWFWDIYYPSRGPCEHFVWSEDGGKLVLKKYGDYSIVEFEFTQPDGIKWRGYSGYVGYDLINEDENYEKLWPPKRDRLVPRDQCPGDDA